jgi:hypothetical protein
MNEKAKKVAVPKSTPATTPEITEAPERDTFFDLRIGEVNLDTKKGGERFSLSIEGGISVYYQKDAEDDEQSTSDTSLTKEDVEDVLMGVLNKIIPTKPTPQPVRVVSVPTSTQTVQQPAPAAPTPIPAATQHVPTNPTTQYTQETVSRDEYKRLVNSMYSMQNSLAELMKVVEKLSTSNK